jgi:hypothetical protein
MDKTCEENTHTKQTDEPRSREDLWIHVKINWERRAGRVNENVWGLFTGLCKWNLSGHGTKDGGAGRAFLGLSQTRASLLLHDSTQLFTTAIITSTMLDDPTSRHHHISSMAAASPLHNSPTHFCLTSHLCHWQYLHPRYQKHW